jgi:hypothetical protein
MPNQSFFLASKQAILPTNFEFHPQSSHLGIDGV